MNFNHPYFNKGAIDKLYADYLKYGTLYIAFDFDNTIWNFNKYNANYEDNPDAVFWDIVNLLKKCKEHGMKLILWTSCPIPWDELKKNQLCKAWGIEPDYLNCSPLSPGAVKPHFSLLLDDKAGLESSVYILEELLKKIENEYFKAE